MWLRSVGASADGIAGVGAALKVKCPRVVRMLSDPSASVIVVEHRDGLELPTPIYTWLYGCRGARHRAMRAVTTVKRDSGQDA